jgi:hypothetical protein
MQARNPTRQNQQRKTPPIAEDAITATAAMQAVTPAAMVAMAKVAALATKEELRAVLRDDPKVALKVVIPAAGAVGVAVKVANAKTPTNVNALTQTEKPWVPMWTYPKMALTVTLAKNADSAMTVVNEMAAKAVPTNAMKRAIAAMSAITIRATFPQTPKATPPIANPVSSAVATDATGTTAAMIADLARTTGPRQPNSTTPTASQETQPHRLRLLILANHAARVTATGVTALNGVSVVIATSPMGRVPRPCQSVQASNPKTRKSQSWSGPPTSRNLPKRRLPLPHRP